MRLQQWAANGWLRPHQTSPARIAGILAIVDRDPHDSTRDPSPDWQFGIAYNAALKLSTILLYASGYRQEKNLAHYRTLAALPLKAQGHRLRMLRKVILSPMSHSNLVNLLTPEISDAIEAVEGLKLSATEAHPGREECRSLLATALAAVIQSAVARVGVALPEGTDAEIRQAIEQIERMSFHHRSVKPALLIARTLAAEEGTE